MDIWCEGYLVTGNDGDASLIASVDALTLREALELHAAVNPAFAAQYDPQQMTYWGCRLFDNEADARKAFG